MQLLGDTMRFGVVVRLPGGMMRLGGIVRLSRRRKNEGIKKQVKFRVT
jgi:hypothetical protein